MTEASESAAFHIHLAKKYPYDEREASSEYQLAAQAVISDLTSRRAIKWGFNNIDEDVRVEIVQSLTEVIRQAVEKNEEAIDALDADNPHGG